MTVAVFCGPTISTKEVRDGLDGAVILPPAQRGDLLLAAREKCDAILLIDGYFDRVPAVWHKEILWAMAQGIHVFGASSMGALRAAELAPFGMVGVGKVFHAYCQGELEDDDEVAVVHGGVESGYRAGSDAMVNVRATLLAARQEGAISPSVQRTIEAVVKALPFERRSLREVLQQYKGSLPRHEICRLLEWLPHGEVNQKKLDALELLRCVAGYECEGWSPLHVDYEFAETDGWVALRNDVEVIHGGECSTSRLALEDELLARGQLGRVLALATMRTLAAKRLQEAGVMLNVGAVEGWIEDFRREHELYRADCFDKWLDGTGLSGKQQEAFLQREAAVRATKAELRNFLGNEIADELRANGSLNEISQCARQKSEILAKSGLENPGFRDIGVTEGELWSWFFCRHLRIPEPRSVEGYAQQEGSTKEAMLASAMRCLLFSRLMAAGCGDR